MKYFESHANGARIEVRASQRTIRRLVSEWRSIQSPPVEEEPERQGAHAQVELAMPYQDESDYGDSMRPRIGFRPNGNR